MDKMIIISTSNKTQAIRDCFSELGFSEKLKKSEMIEEIKDISIRTDLKEKLIMTLYFNRIKYSIKTI
jgi:hypothetical protein